MRFLKLLRTLAVVLLLFVFGLMTATAGAPKMFVPDQPLNATPDSRLGGLCKYHWVQIWAGLDWCLDEYDPPEPKQVEPTTPGPKDYCFTDRITPEVSPPRDLKPARWRQ